MDTSSFADVALAGRGLTEASREALRYTCKCCLRPAPTAHAYRTPLHEVCDVDGGDPKDVVRLLVSAGVDVNSRQRGSGMTPLHSSAVSPSPGVSRALLDNGADIDAADDEGGTPLHFAARALSPRTAARAVLARMPTTPDRPRLTSHWRTCATSTTHGKPPSPRAASSAGSARRSSWPSNGAPPAALGGRPRGALRRRRRHGGAHCLVRRGGHRVTREG